MAAPKHSSEKITPAMSQYLKIKSEHPDYLLLYQMGDFYEMFFEDAKRGAKICNLALTTRSRTSENPIPMAGIPIHALDNYLIKLINEGESVAICDQIEKADAAASAKRIIKREISRLVTPGTLTSDKHLRQKEENIIVAYCHHKKKLGLARLELSSGRFCLSEYDDRPKLADEIVKISPAEIVFREDETCLTQTFTQRPLPPWYFAYESCFSSLCKQLQCQDLCGFGCQHMPAAVCAAGALLEFVKTTQCSALPHICNVQIVKNTEFIEISSQSREALNISSDPKKNAGEHNLTEQLDTTCCTMGSRCLRRWFRSPLRDMPKISRRHDAVAWFINFSQHDSLRNSLRKIPDIERITARIALLSSSPRDLISLADSLELVPEIQLQLAGCKDPMIQQLAMNMDPHAELQHVIRSAIEENPPPLLRDGGVIRERHNKKLDEMRQIYRDTNHRMREIERYEKEKTKLDLQLSYNKVVGYYFEVSKAKAALLPDYYTRIQTLKNHERFTITALRDFEAKIVASRSKALAYEKELFHDLMQRIIPHLKTLQNNAEAISQMDVLSTFADRSIAFNYSRPSFSSDYGFSIKNGRHPIVEQSLDGRFVPNNCICDRQHRLLIITGPNMGGKSTYMRQTALIVFMAYVGHFVPAENATLGPVDKIFTRIGAFDDISSGRSTFMVEMTEAAYILNNATQSSLVIMDEIGRGTSTFDGLSIAWACCDYLANTNQAMTLFATHYFELTSLTDKNPDVHNLHTYAVEHQEKTVFMYKIANGAATQSFGIQVAKLAGIPRAVLNMAKKKLRSLEAKQHSFSRANSLRDNGQLCLEFAEQPAVEKHEEDDKITLIHQLLSALDPDATSPKQALEFLYQLKKITSEEGRKHSHPI